MDLVPMVLFYGKWLRGNPFFPFPSSNTLLRMHDEGEIDVQACYIAISVASVLNILDDELIKNVGDYILRLVSRSNNFNFGTKSYCLFLAWRQCRRKTSYNLNSLFFSVS
ncbi:Protein farnesyltransferase subunit beta [Glycine soja]